jgi:hypothetical protein
MEVSSDASGLLADTGKGRRTKALFVKLER